MRRARLPAAIDDALGGREPELDLWPEFTDALLYPYYTVSACHPRGRMTIDDLIYACKEIP